MKERKRIRMGHEVYREGGRIFSITLCTKEKERLFPGSKLADDFFSILKELSKKDGISVYAYCFMPDHLHLLIEVSGDVGVVDFIREFKGMSTKSAWGLGHRGVVW